MSAFALALRPAVDIRAREHLGAAVASRAAPAQRAPVGVFASTKYPKTTGSPADVKAPTVGFRRQFVSVGQKSSVDFETSALTVAQRQARKVGVAPASTIPLLKFKPTARKTRVAAGLDEKTIDTPVRYNTAEQPTLEEADAMIAAAYLQVMNIHNFAAERQAALESAVRSGRITVKQFIRGLATAPAFMEAHYYTGTNYRFVDTCFQRLLGRSVYSREERLAWSMVIATAGVPGFVEALLDSEEYAAAFGEHTVPYQRQRRFAGRQKGAPLTRVEATRYGADYRSKRPQGLNPAPTRVRRESIGALAFL